MDTACSSALVGAHLGMQHLRSHRGSVLAAGVNLMLAETTTAAAQVAGMLTLDGRCKTLDAAADGYVRRAHAPMCPHMPRRNCVVLLCHLLWQPLANGMCTTAGNSMHDIIVVSLCM